MNTKDTGWGRKWDATDDWAVRTFGYRGTQPSRRVARRNGLHQTVGQVAFDALFRSSPVPRPAQAY